LLRVGVGAIVDFDLLSKRNVNECYEATWTFPMIERHSIVALVIRSV
jgi:hypothetical protein